MREELENVPSFRESLTFAGGSRAAPLPRGSAARGLGAAGDVALLTAGRAGRIVAEVAQRVGADQTSVLEGSLCLTGHN